MGKSRRNSSRVRVRVRVGLGLGLGLGLGRMDPNPKPRLQREGSMLEEADRLASLVDRLHTLSRAETGHAPPSLDVFDLSVLAQEVAGHLEVLAEEKRQSIVVESPATQTAHGDRAAVRQALINLVDNAIKFSPEDSRILIRVPASADTATVEVVDRGAGIDEAAKSRIFERFYRAANVPVGANGAGLGLPIARGAVEASGGRLTLVASDADGSTFRIELPRAGQAPVRVAS